MNQLIKIEEKYDETTETMEQLVSAREIHKNLGVKKRFSLWWKRSKDFLGFEETCNCKEQGSPFCTCENTSVNVEGNLGCGSSHTLETTYKTGELTGGPLGTPVKYEAIVGNGAKQQFADYLITIDQAKILCMISKTKKANDIRKYFIEVEKAWNNPDKIIQRSMQILQHRYDNVLLAYQAQKPAVEFTKAVSDATNAVSIGDFAKTIYKITKLGRNRLFELLRNYGYLKNDNLPYQQFIEQDLFKVITLPYQTNYGTKISTKTLLTGKGQIYFTKKLEKMFGCVNG
ncbi:MAG: phage antirepressor KilAC domain-containing protein [Bifidobacteriaceae bacterium]|jgi:anti-repressor protein|nr:phage antirepressor KilAC domain-containing protein [Bifidobacteriaceae bacterium]